MTHEKEKREKGTEKEIRSGLGVMRNKGLQRPPLNINL